MRFRQCSQERQLTGIRVVSVGPAEICAAAGATRAGPDPSRREPGKIPAISWPVPTFAVCRRLDRVMVTICWAAQKLSP
jgi:hypothetical protein